MSSPTTMLRPDALVGRTIVVTGGGTGLGRSMAKTFLQLGANVCITSRKLDALEKAAKELTEETGGTVLPVACDVRSHLEVDKLVAAVLERFGSCDA
ncbi:MAG: SDR family NAD(P)-dependent oxidoreductase, partial [Flavobacteriales bacterium]|nr:SDR family NAD(P)-dependent oxidoreductase [Flavobacteriales bacterium]